jgi:hypothetical protein
MSTGGGPLGKRTAKKWLQRRRGSLLRQLERCPCLRAQHRKSEHCRLFQISLKNETAPAGRAEAVLSGLSCQGTWHLRINLANLLAYNSPFELAQLL